MLEEALRSQAKDRQRKPLEQQLDVHWTPAGSFSESSAQQERIRCTGREGRLKSAPLSLDCQCGRTKQDWLWGRKWAGTRSLKVPAHVWMGLGYADMARRCARPSRIEETPLRMFS